MFTIFRTPIGTTLPSSFQNFGPSQHANTRASSTASDTKQWRPFTKESLAELQLLPSFSGITLGSHPTSGVTTAISFPKASFLLPFVEQSCFFLKFGPNIFRNLQSGNVLYTDNEWLKMQQLKLQQEKLNVDNAKQAMRERERAMNDQRLAMQNYQHILELGQKLHEEDAQRQQKMRQQQQTPRPAMQEQQLMHGQNAQWSPAEPMQQPQKHQLHVQTNFAQTEPQVHMLQQQPNEIVSPEGNHQQANYQLPEIHQKRALPDNAGLMQPGQQTQQAFPSQMYQQQNEPQINQQTQHIPFQQQKQPSLEHGHQSRHITPQQTQQQQDPADVLQRAIMLTRQQPRAVLPQQQQDMSGDQQMQLPLQVTQQQLSLGQTSIQNLQSCIQTQQQHQPSKTPMSHPHQEQHLQQTLHQIQQTAPQQAKRSTEQVHLLQTAIAMTKQQQQPTLQNLQSEMSVEKTQQLKKSIYRPLTPGGEQVAKTGPATQHRPHQQQLRLTLQGSEQSAPPAQVPHQLAQAELQQARQQRNLAQVIEQAILMTRQQWPSSQYFERNGYNPAQNVQHPMRASQEVAYQQLLPCQAQINALQGSMQPQQQQQLQPITFSTNINETKPPPQHELLQQRRIEQNPALVLQQAIIMTKQQSQTAQQSPQQATPIQKHAQTLQQPKTRQIALDRRQMGSDRLAVQSQFQQQLLASSQDGQNDEKISQHSPEPRLSQEAKQELNPAQVLQNAMLMTRKQPQSTSTRQHYETAAQKQMQEPQQNAFQGSLLQKVHLLPQTPLMAQPNPCQLDPIQGREQVLQQSGQTIRRFMQHQPWKQSHMQLQQQQTQPASQRAEQLEADRQRQMQLQQQQAQLAAQRSAQLEAERRRQMQLQQQQAQLDTKTAAVYFNAPAL
uniref:Nuclear transcription factor Y subunit n=1 Tax=Ascaris lumbricoides TaxID=6252 RepID=A0A0M3IVV5_ASCLU